MALFIDSDPSDPKASLDMRDIRRIKQLSEIILTTPMQNVTRLALGELHGKAVINRIVSECDFAHGAILVFPCEVEAALTGLRELGYCPGPIIPSIVVKRRLSERYGLDNEAVEVKIVHGAATAADGTPREIELFMITSPSVQQKIAEDERALEHEKHFAFRVRDAGPRRLQDIAAALLADGDFNWDGGGFNPHERADKGGTTIAYFTSTRDHNGDGPLHRLELQCYGDHSRIFAKT